MPEGRWNVSRLCFAFADGQGFAFEVSEETGWQYHPEQTTSAIICHHPQAKYFIAR